MRDASPDSERAWTARYPDLAQKTVYISGGATGIGASIVSAFAAQGAQIVFSDIDAEAGEALAAAITASGARQPTFHRCDVTDTDALFDSIDRAQAIQGRLDAMINNAANDRRHDPETVDPDFFDWCVAVNLKHQYFASQRAFQWMKAQGTGSIVNFGSVAPRLGQHDLSIYGAMKTAVTGMTRTLSNGFGAHGVRVNAIVPGVILTPRQLRDWISPETEAKMRSLQHLDRRLVGDDIAPTALFLASDASNAIASQSIAVDAGLTSQG